MITTLSKQAGRRYPQINAMITFLVGMFSSTGTTSTTTPTLRQRTLTGIGL